MLQNQRQSLHQKIGETYELQIKSNPGQAAQLLPLIAFHFGLTNHAFKKILSLERVSYHYVETGAYSEG